MKPIDLIHLQIYLEYQLDPRGMLVPFPSSSEQALYLVYHHTEGHVPYFSHLLPPDLRQQLLTLGPGQAFANPGEVRRMITAGYQPCGGGDQIFWSGYFPRQPDPSEFPDVVLQGEECVVIVEGQTVCRAVSVRQNEDAHEAYVETNPDFQQRGFGRQAVAAWAYQVMQRGQVALYSDKMTNLTSAALARRLGIGWYADVIGFE